MKKVLLSVFAIVIAITSVSAQTKGTSKLSIGAEFGLPVGDFATAFDVGFGGSVVYQHAVADKLYLTANAGYVTYQGKVNFLGSNLTFNADFIPVKAGMKYFIAKNFYGSAELGASFATGSGSSGTAFAYSPGLGIEFPVSDKGSVDVGARYEAWSNNGTLSFVGLRAAFNFGL
ncbi:MAG: hypothetical protein EOO89_04555 [Pedobacter sp.]|nr:MAG: hypothetical protein EOO89_04555 [Pedobacter sp.]